MSSTQGFPWKKFLLRIIFAFFLVFITYNPTQISYFHWLFSGITSFSDFQHSISLFKVFIGISILIAWVVFLYATARSLGKWGITLALIFYTTFILLLIGYEDFPQNKPIITQYAILLLISLVIGTGLSWQIIYRWLSGMYEKHDSVI